MNTRGFTLIETMMYIGLMAILLPTVTVSIVSIVRLQSQVSTRVLISQTGAAIVEEMTYELQRAQSVDTASSVYSSDSSSISFIDRNGQSTTISRVSDTFDIEGTTRQIDRLMVTQGIDTYWLTSNELTVDVFELEPVRNDQGDLTALNMRLVFTPHVTDREIQQAAILDLETAVHLSSYVEES